MYANHNWVQVASLKGCVLVCVCNHNIVMCLCKDYWGGPFTQIVGQLCNEVCDGVSSNRHQMVQTARHSAFCCVNNFLMLMGLHHQQKIVALALFLWCIGDPFKLCCTDSVTIGVFLQSISKWMVDNGKASHGVMATKECTVITITNKYNLRCFQWQILSKEEQCLLSKVHVYQLIPHCHPKVCWVVEWTYLFRLIFAGKFLAAKSGDYESFYQNVSAFKWKSHVQNENSEDRPQTLPNMTNGMFF